MNHTYLDVLGIGSIKLGSGYVHSVYYIPDLDKNYLSIYALTHSNMLVEFIEKSAFIREAKDQRLIVVGKVCNFDYTFIFLHFTSCEEDNHDATSKHRGSSQLSSVGSS